MVSVHGNWTLRQLDSLLSWSFHLLDTLPTGDFTYWTVRLLSGHFAYLLLITFFTYALRI